MEEFRKILFFADGARGEKGALSRALLLAQHNGAELTVMDVVPEVGTDDPRLSQSIKKLQRALVNERQDAVRKLLGESMPAGKPPKIRVRVIAAEKDYLGIVDAAVQGDFQLLIKSVNATNIISAKLFGSIDLKLMRHCPCPVWIIKPTRRTRVSSMLAAVDLTSDEKETVSLAERILEIATGLARIEGASLHVLAAWDQPIDPAMKRHVDATVYDDYISRYKETIHKRMDRLIAGHKASKLSDHIVKGKPEKAISDFLKANDVDLLIMGTLSRSGIPGLLIGNTAERVLNEVDCSVLTLKPIGFKPPVS